MSLSRTIDRTSLAPNSGRFRRAVGSMIAALLAQFLIGMWVNLYATIPRRHPGTNGDYFSSLPQVIIWALGRTQEVALELHVVLGLLVGLGALGLIFQAVRAAVGSWVLWTIIGAIGVIGAGLNGASFLIYGHDFSSLLMATGLAVAVASYAFALTRT